MTDNILLTIVAGNNLMRIKINRVNVSGFFRGNSNAVERTSLAASKVKIKVVEDDGHVS